jgi:hypothetical protein
LWVFNVLDANELTLDSHLIPVLDSAHIQGLKVFQNILVADPEATIVVLSVFLDVGGAHCFFELGGPLGRFPPPVSFPLIVL